MILFKNADVYAPKHLGCKDVLVEGSKIVAIEEAINGYDNLTNVQIIDVNGKKMGPGYIDLHEHITGGGGEQGPVSRTPEATIGTLLDCGVTTVLGLLGTDGISRSLENLLAKARALNEEGITCYALTGSYGYPSVNITGSIERDITLIDLIIGVKLAVSDHRSSNPQGEEIIKVATAARRAGLLAPCCGLVTMHMGSGKGRLEPIFYALEHSDILAKNLLPTHMNTRGKELLDDGIRFTKMGGHIDFTASGTIEGNNEEAMKVKYCLEQGAPLSGITVSSDGYGSQPRFNVKGECIGLTYSTPCGLHQLVESLVKEKVLKFEEALTLVTSNAAQVLDMSNMKGNLVIGADADLLIYNADLKIESVFAKGKAAIWKNEHIIKGRFEV